MHVARAQYGQAMLTQLMGPGGRPALLRCDEWTLRDFQEQARYQ